MDDCILEAAHKDDDHEDEQFCGIVVFIFIQICVNICFSSLYLYIIYPRL